IWWSHRNPQVSDPKSCGSSRHYIDGSDHYHDYYGGARRRHHGEDADGDQRVDSVLAKNKALQASIVQLEEEKARLQQILQEHKTQRQNDPQRCRHGLGNGKAS
ncbi:hypothetical protein Micbo1qcDRAFT_169927, partial [Microdochium bolleyi]